MNRQTFRFNSSHCFDHAGVIPSVVFYQSRLLSCSSKTSSSSLWFDTKTLPLRATSVSQTVGHEASDRVCTCAANLPKMADYRRVCGQKRQNIWIFSDYHKRPCCIATERNYFVIRKDCRFCHLNNLSDKRMFCSNFDLVLSNQCVFDRVIAIRTNWLRHSTLYKNQ